MNLFLANNNDSKQFDDIKLWLRKYMDGSVSSKMALNGLSYRINYGVSIVHVRRYASELVVTQQLALRLWNSNIRECMLMATLLLKPDISDKNLLVLRDNITNIELAEQFGFNFGFRLNYPATTLLPWLNSNNEFVRISALLSVSTLLQRGLSVEDSELRGFYNQSIELEFTSATFRHAMVRLLTNFIKVNGYFLEIQALMKVWKQGVDVVKMAVADEILIEIEYAK